MTTVYLFDSPFDDSGRHLLIPSEKSVEGFLSEILNAFPHKRYDNVTWERVGQTLRIPVRYDELKKYNYMVAMADDGAAQRVSAAGTKPALTIGNVFALLLMEEVLGVRMHGHGRRYSTQSC